MKKIKKRGAVYGVVALLLSTAAYLNWSYVAPPADLLPRKEAKPKAAAQESQVQSRASWPPEGQGYSRQLRCLR